MLKVNDNFICVFMSIQSCNQNQMAEMLLAKIKAMTTLSQKVINQPHPLYIELLCISANLRCDLTHTHVHTAATKTSRESAFSLFFDSSVQVFVFKPSPWAEATADHLWQRRRQLLLTKLASSIILIHQRSTWALCDLSLSLSPTLCPR